MLAKRAADADAAAKKLKEENAKLTQDAKRQQDRNAELTKTVEELRSQSQAKQPQPQVAQNLLQELISLGKQNKLHDEMARIEEFMAKVKERHGTDAATYLGCNTAVSNQIKFSDNYYGWKYIGEWSA